MLIALDLGQTTGVAASGNGKITSTFINLKSNGKSFPEQLLYFKRFLVKVCGTEIAIKEGVEFVVEIPHGGYFHANKFLFGMLGVLWLTSIELGFVVHELAPKSIKRFWTGSGNSGKDGMVDEASRRGFKATDHNEVDALAMLHLQLSKGEADAHTVPVQV